MEVTSILRTISDRLSATTVNFRETFPQWRHAVPTELRSIFERSIFIYLQNLRSALRPLITENKWKLRAWSSHSSLWRTLIYNDRNWILKILSFRLFKWFKWAETSDQMNRFKCLSACPVQICILTTQKTCADSLIVDWFTWPVNLMKVDSPVIVDGNLWWFLD